MKMLILNKTLRKILMTLMKMTSWSLEIHHKNNKNNNNSSSVTGCLRQISGQCRLRDSLVREEPLTEH